MTPAGIAQWAAVATMLALAGALLLLQFSNRVARAFAAFLVLRAAVSGANRLQASAATPEAALVWDRTGLWFALAVPFALAYFLAAHLVDDRRRARPWRLAAAGAGLLALAAFAFDRCLVRCDDRLGPLSLVTFGTPLAYGLAALGLAALAARATDGPRRQATLLVTAGLLLNAVADAGVALSQWIVVGPAAQAAVFAPSPWTQAAVFSVGLAAVPAAAALARLLTHPASRPAGRRMAVAAALAAASGAFVGVAPLLGPEALQAGLVLLALWRLALPLLAAYALVRYRLFDLDVRVRWTVGKGTVAGTFLAVFLVGSEIAENALDARLGVVGGGVAAGFLLLALAPLQRLGERVAEVVVPGARPLAELPRDDRLAIYREQARIAWANGTLDRAERALLDRLRTRLGLPAEDALRLETEAAEAAA